MDQALINQYINEMSDYLVSYSHLVETRLHDISNSVTQCQSNLVILERKLDSIHTNK